MGPGIDMGMGSMRLWSRGGLELGGVGEGRLEFVEFFCPRSFCFVLCMVVRMQVMSIN